MIGSLAPVWVRQLENHGEKPPLPDLAVPDKAQSVFTVSLTLAASTGGMSNTSHHTDFPSPIRLLYPQIHSEMLSETREDFNSPLSTQIQLRSITDKDDIIM